MSQQTPLIGTVLDRCRVNVCRYLDPCWCNVYLGDTYISLFSDLFAPLEYSLRIAYFRSIYSNSGYCCLHLNFASWDNYLCLMQLYFKCEICLKLTCVCCDLNYACLNAWKFEFESSDLLPPIVNGEFKGWILKVIYHPLYGMNNYVLIWGDWLSCDPLRGSHDSQLPHIRKHLCSILWQLWFICHKSIHTI